ncbi:hypothetical protein [Thalassobaculum litoreum]|uniref:hypothetical protein n=1 Tax=Thalassobaculum litoreum TaxID=420996 RepID=UPI001FDFF12B|nr:hypothetical protein [Thalassobaculum litoreum]
MSGHFGKPRLLKLQLFDLALVGRDDCRLIGLHDPLDELGRFVLNRTQRPLGVRCALTGSLPLLIPGLSEHGLEEID